MGRAVKIFGSYFILFFFIYRPDIYKRLPDWRLLRALIWAGISEDKFERDEKICFESLVSSLRGETSLFTIWKNLASPAPFHLGSVQGAVLNYAPVIKSTDRWTSAWWAPGGAGRAASRGTCGFGSKSSTGWRPGCWRAAPAPAAGPSDPSRA